MKAMVLKKVSPIEKEPLEMIDLPDPVPCPKEILVKVSACGICHTELDEIEGRIQPRLWLLKFLLSPRFKNLNEEMQIGHCYR
jgi:D-arabinose 1-dehydrogenase-like Zn-dependent alcohol dehydrogenase